ncbi:NAD(P)H-dependent oxidoreductase [Streptococcus sp. DD12]|uniref:NAD(P)H-dependent oxidoreductase n=1 Tax=Streptococcus sp. DD12 TaxID=1777880 RepID=UPI000797777A|nr:NAD(P)H-dependent oxidoreductase [Streptococcus sp. DD12]KXT76231.1 Oxygen-insensitive NAD(P)H nitroreductase / Dihydropteridine reductase [Streptococcus sp. DD12]
MNKPFLSPQDIRQALDFRTAVRVYSERKIPKADLATILDSAWLAPSSIGLEPWRFVVLENPEIKAAIKPYAWGAQTQLETASHFVLLIASKDVRYDSDNVYQSLVRRGLTDELTIQQRLARYEDFQKKDQGIAESTHELWQWSAKQTYIALGNMMMTASLLGIDSCPIEGFHYESVNRVLAEYQVLDPETEGISVMLSLGYRAEEPKHRRSRKDRKDVIFWK